MPNPSSRPECGACIAGCRRNVDVPHAKLALQSTNEKRVMDNASAHADLFHSCLLQPYCDQVSDHLGYRCLDAARDIPLLLERELGLVCRQGQSVKKTLGGHETTSKIAPKVAQVKFG